MLRSKFHTLNPLKILFIIVYKSYQGSKADRGIEYYSATCFYLAIFMIYAFAFLDFFNLFHFVYLLFEQKYWIIFLFFLITSTIIYLILKKVFKEQDIRAIEFSKSETTINNILMWLILVFGLCICVIANNYNRCTVFSIKPGYGFTKENPKCCERCR